MEFTHGLQIVHWKNHLKFPEDAKISPEAKDLICRLLCDVEHRLGTGGAAQIKVLIGQNRFLALFFFLLFTGEANAGSRLVHRC